MSRIALVTGASQGIGREIAVSFARAGYSVVLVARNGANLADTAAMVESEGGEALVLPTDITDPQQVDEMAATAVGHFGQVDVVVNNSGIGGPSRPVWELTPEEWRETFAVNVDGVFLVSRALLPQMLERRSGSVIIIGSISGKRPLWGRSPYAASKSALVGLTRAMALEAGPQGVRVNLISPGFVTGPRLDWVVRAQAEGRGISEDEVRLEFEREAALHRLTEPADVARAALFLASEDSQAITGSDLNVNSGVVMY